MVPTNLNEQDSIKMLIRTSDPSIGKPVFIQRISKYNRDEINPLLLPFEFPE